MRSNGIYKIKKEWLPRCFFIGNYQIQTCVLGLAKYSDVFDWINSGFTLGLEECLQSRPPLQLDLTGPKPTSYDPPPSLPWETSSPSYTMRPKTQPEKGIKLVHLTYFFNRFHKFI